MDMSHQEEKTKDVEEMTEEQFLKDLYLYMKKRNTPIERIPHLGFKQIDLFLMYKTVREFGGYHQVTAQQLWKQVYNRLGGNPRSTSAATCTRRHYEKMLLPYECHVKGIQVNTFLQNQTKHFPYPSYGKDDAEVGPSPAKRKMMSMPLAQGGHNLQSDLHGSTFASPLHYPHYYNPNHPILAPYIPITSPVLTPHNQAAPETQFPFQPPHLNPTDRFKEPLEHLRLLAEQYKTSSGLSESEPLNLSNKGSNQLESSGSPASSFSPPSSSKSPKFLNKPFPLYTPLQPRVVKSEEGETQESDPDVEITSYSHPANAREAYVIDVRAVASSSSPERSATSPPRADGDALPTPTPVSPKTEQPEEERERSPDSRMEIQIPLSVFHSWLKLCRSSATMPGTKQLQALLNQTEQSRQNGSETNVLPTNLSLHASPQNWRSAPEDLRLRPATTVQTPANQNQNHVTNYKSLSTGGIAKSSDVYTFNHLDSIQSYVCKPQTRWDSYAKEPSSSVVPVKSEPLRMERDFKSYRDQDASKGTKERPDAAPSAVLMLDSGSASLLHLTSEEVMKLKRIISSS